MARPPTDSIERVRDDVPSAVCRLRSGGIFAPTCRSCAHLVGAGAGIVIALGARDVMGLAGRHTDKIHFSRQVKSHAGKTTPFSARRCRGEEDCLAWRGRAAPDGGSPVSSRDRPGFAFRGGPARRSRHGRGRERQVHARSVRA